MAESIFVSLAPDLTNENDGGAFQDLGTVWTPNADGVVTGIRWRFPDTLPGGTVVGLLWAMVDNDHGTELGRANFTAPVAGDWNVATFATPAVVTAGQFYCASIHSPDRYVARVGVFDGTSVSNGSHLTAIENLVPYANGRFAFNQASPTFPAAGSGNKACYFADVVFSTVAAVLIGPAVESTTAAGVTRIQMVAPAVETDTAGRLTRVQMVGAAVETDSAGGVTQPGARQMVLRPSTGTITRPYIGTVNRP